MLHNYYMCIICSKLYVNYTHPKKKIEIEHKQRNKKFRQK